jgi:hypothetical protein
MEKQPTAHPGLKPEAVLSPSLLHADRWTPPVRSIISTGFSPLHWKPPAGVTPAPSLHTNCPSRPDLLKPGFPLSALPFPLSRITARPSNQPPELRHPRRHRRRISPGTESPVLSLQFYFLPLYSAHPLTPSFLALTRRAVRSSQTPETALTSSRCSPSPQEELVDVDQTPEVAVLCCTPSASSPLPGTSETSSPAPSGLSTAVSSISGDRAAR